MGQNPACPWDRFVVKLLGVFFNNNPNLLHSRQEILDYTGFKKYLLKRITNAAKDEGREEATLASEVASDEASVVASALRLIGLDEDHMEG